MSGPIQSMADPMSGYNISLRHAQEQEKIKNKKIDEEAAEKRRLNRPKNEVSDNPSKAYEELSKKISQRHYEFMFNKPSSSSSLESSTSSNGSNSSNANTNKYCCIQ